MTALWALSCLLLGAARAADFSVRVVEPSAMPGLPAPAVPSDAIASPAQPDAVSPAALAQARLSASAAGAQAAAVALGVPEPAALSSRSDVVAALQSAYAALRRQADRRGPPAERVERLRALGGLLHDYLGGIETTQTLPEEARQPARRARERYLSEDRLTGALLWGRQEKERVARARLRAKADGALPRSAATTSQTAPWSPPSQPGPPARAGTGTTRFVRDLRALKRDFDEETALYELARGRRDAALRRRLPAASREREQARWKAAAGRFSTFLTRYEQAVDYHLDHALRMGFSDAAARGRSLFVPTQPGLSLTRDGDGYRLEAELETRIDDPGVIEAFRRAVESYWNGRVETPDGAIPLRTRVRVRKLGSNEAFSPLAIRLLDGGTASGGGAFAVLLRRDFELGVAAHEFGHVLGLPDEYVNDYRPEDYQAVNESDQSSLMSSSRTGLVQPRHLAEIVRLFALRAQREAQAAQRQAN